MVKTIKQLADELKAPNKLLNITTKDYQQRINKRTVRSCLVSLLLIIQSGLPFMAQL